MEKLMLHGAYKTRKIGGKFEIDHVVYGWVELLKIKSGMVTIRRFSSEHGLIKHNEPVSAFRLKESQA